MFFSRKPTIEHEGPINAGRDAWEVAAETAKRRPISMVEYARKMGMQPSRLDRLFGKKVAEVPIAPFVQRSEALSPDSRVDVAPNAGRDAWEVAAEARQASLSKAWEGHRATVRAAVDKGSELSGEGSLPKGGRFSPLTSESDFASPVSQDVASTARPRVRRLRTVKARSK